MANFYNSSMLMLKQVGNMPSDPAKIKENLTASFPPVGMAS